jgi:hypothetical protein
VGAGVGARYSVFVVYTCFTGTKVSILTLEEVRR